MILSILLMGCPQPQPAYECKANPSWISQPQQPSDVADGESFCDFYQFGWQWFLAQTSPNTSNTERVFEMQRVFHPGETNQCSMEIEKGRKTNVSQISPRIMKTDLEDIQADGHTLYDQNGNILFYNIWYSEASCHATNTSFVPGTFEIKASWMKIDEKREDMFVIDSGDGLLGMVGFHMAIWTPKHHEMLWYSWEHKDNAPLCDGTSPIKKYHFTSEAASECLTKKGGCTEYEFNKPTSFKDTPPITGKPNEVCRVFKNGNQSGKSINGNDNALNGKVIDELNEQLVGEAGYLTLLSDKNPMKVWSNYKMIGGIWTKDGKDSDGSPVPHKGGEADKNSYQRGSLELTNTSMETFEQGSTSAVPNCFGCHDYSSKKELDVSHIFTDLRSK